MNLRTDTHVTPQMAPIAGATTKIRPLHDRVLVRPIETADQTEGGIFLPDNAKGKSTRGRVIAVGSGRRHERSGELHALTVKVGDVVIYPKYTGTEIRLGRETVMMFDERELLGVEEDN